MEDDLGLDIWGWVELFSLNTLSAKNKPQCLYEFIWINTLSTVYSIYSLPNDKIINPQFYKSGD